MNDRVVRGHARFMELEARWRAIAAAGGVRTPYQSFAWLDQWLRHQGRDLEPFTLLIQDGTTIAPLGMLRLAGIRVLRLLGTGDSDYADIVSTLAPDEAWDGIAQELARHRSAWDLLHLHSVRDREAILEALNRHVGLLGYHRPYEVCPLVPTDRSWEELLAGRGKKLEYEIRRWSRKLESLGEISVTVTGSPVPEPIIAELESVERASWKWVSGEAAFRPGAQRDFLEALLRDPRMEIQLWLLRVSGRLVGYALVLTGRERWYYYLPSFRKDYPHAGSYLLARIIQGACNSPCVSLDLLRGSHAYKYAWTDMTHTVYEIVWPSSLRGCAAAVAYAARWRAAQSSLLRRLRSRFWNTGDRRASRGEAAAV